jgi:hypothetical protein
MSTADVPPAAPDPRVPDAAAASNATPPTPRFPDGTTGAAFHPSTRVEARNKGRVVYIVLAVIVPVVLAGFLAICAFGGMFAILWGAGSNE